MTVPPNGITMWHTSFVHHNPDIYTDPMTWDPSRFSPERAEGSEVPFSFAGWGLGAHVCPGQKVRCTSMGECSMSYSWAVSAVCKTRDRHADPGVARRVRPQLGRSRRRTRPSDGSAQPERSGRRSAKGPGPAQVRAQVASRVKLSKLDIRCIGSPFFGQGGSSETWFWTMRCPGRTIRTMRIASLFLCEEVSHLDAHPFCEHEHRS